MVVGGETLTKTHTPTTPPYTTGIGTPGKEANEGKREFKKALRRIRVGSIETHDCDTGESNIYAEKKKQVN
jgi:hypothetical protein